MFYSHYFDVLTVLLKKNFKILGRDFVSLIIIVFAPFLVNLVIYFGELTYRNNAGFNIEAREEPNPPISSLRTIPTCFSLEPQPQQGSTLDQIMNGQNCITIAFTPDENSQNNSQFGAQVQQWVNKVAQIGGVPPEQVVGFPTEDQLNNFLAQNPNRTQAAYIFDLYSQQLLQQSQNITVSYTVQYNKTAQLVFPLGSTKYFEQRIVPAMFTLMNEVILAEKLGKPITLDFSTSIFPHPNLPGNADAYTEYGPFLVFGLYMLSVVLFLFKLVNEKELKLREYLKISGMYQSQHYISWFIPFFLLMLITTLLNIAFGAMFQFQFFFLNSFGIYFITNFLFGTVLIFWTFFFDSLIKRSAAVSNAIFIFFIIGYLLAQAGIFFYGQSSDGEDFLASSLHWLRYVAALLPSTCYYKITYDLAFAASVDRGIDFSMISDNTAVFPITTCWLWIVWPSLVVLVLAVYLENVLPSALGYRYPLYYPFSPSYWGCGKPKQVHIPDTSNRFIDDNQQLINNYEDIADVQHTDAIDSDVYEEAKAIANNDPQKLDAALLIRNIKKAFGSFVAVNDISVSIEHNSLFALLGHNGAGKSTLFNMLCGLISVTEGDASIYGFSVVTQQNELRQIIGVCPQHDVLWKQLTSAEHIEIFSTLKKIPKEQRPDEITRRLEQVSLTDVRNKYAGQYSGGMQRRLSVAISLTGDPKMVFLDEPTTGMDPVSRRKVWEMIQAAKKDRVIVLVTHSMEEADILGDRVGIIARGKLRVLGTPLRLKNKFGAGYKLSALSEEEKPVSDFLQEQQPGTKLENEDKAPNGDRVLEYALPRSSMQKLAEIVKAIEKQKSELGIHSFSISQSTLEEVFLRITGLWEEDEPVPEEKTSGCCKCIICCGCFGACKK